MIFVVPKCKLLLAISDLPIINWASDNKLALYVPFPAVIGLISKISPIGPTCLAPPYAPPSSGTELSAIISTGREIIFLMAIFCR